MKTLKNKCKIQCVSVCDFLENKKDIEKKSAIKFFMHEIRHCCSCRVCV